MTAVNLSTPKGFLASLAGVPYCPESALSGPGSLSDPARSGQDELFEPACPETSQIGTVVAGSGAGTIPSTRRVASTSPAPTKGADLSLVVVTPAVSGPYDLGNVVDRVRVFVDPVTAQISADVGPDPARSWTESRSACARSRSTSTAPTSPSTRPTAIRSRSPPPSSATRAGSAARASGFQVGNCAALPFAPKLQPQLRGSTKRRGHPALHAVVTGIRARRI